MMLLPRILLFLTLCYLVSVMLVVGSLAAMTKHFKWEVEYIFWAPDCEERVVIGINGQFPGPTIRAQQGDTIHVDLTNKLQTEGVVIHWHGIRQLETPWADGTASISQCAINPGETFTYKFKVDKAGTYFYHGHYGMQRSAGLYGSLIVDVAEGRSEPFHYDDEFNLLLSDWWHQSAHDQEVALFSKPFRWVGEPQTILVNGRGQYNCSLAPNFTNSSSTECKFSGSEQCAPNILLVEPNKTYRLRLASTTSLSSLNLAIGDHELTVVETDGNYVTPFTVNDLDIYSGDSYSVLLHTNQDPTQNYWVSIVITGRQPKTQPSLTILNYKPTTSSKLPTIPPPITHAWDDYNHSKTFLNKILSLNGSSPPPSTFDRRITLLNTLNRADGYTRWAINNISLSLPSTPYLGLIKYGIKKGFNQTNPPDEFSSSYDIMVPPKNPNTTVGNGVYNIEYNSTVDIIIQNANVALAPNLSEIHPWHLHGHDFWVLGYGEGKFGKRDEAKFNLKNPPLRNNAVIFPFGWTALRFKADNPGVWPFHCHIESHLHMGMGIVLNVEAKRVKNIPREALECGLTAKLFSRKIYMP